MTSAEGGNDAPAERAESDDYDLLTFGEVAARLDELLAAEKAELARLHEDSHPDPVRVRLLEERIAALTASADRHRDQARTNDVFTRKFGAATFAPPNAQPPRWT